MAKHISNVRDRIFAVSKKHLFEKGYTGLTLREVAAKSGIAVGTIYNYFTSKDMLVATIMAEDWLLSINRLEEVCTSTATVEQGVRAIYQAIVGFVIKYEPIWNDYNGVPKSFTKRQVMLRRQLSDLLADLLILHGHKEDLALCHLLTETILSCAMQPDIAYEPLATLINRLFK